MSSEPKKEKKNSNAEKPISLFGATFEKVLDALLKTSKPEKKKDQEETV